MIGDRIVEGSQFIAGEIAHMVIGLNDIVIYGSPVIDDPVFRQAVQDAINGRVFSPFRKPVAARRTQLGGDIDLLGEVVAVLRSTLPNS